MRLLSLLLPLLLAASASGQVHPDDQVKRDEHEAVMRLIPVATMPHQAVASGAWDAPATWSGGAVPDAESIVYVPAGIRVTGDGSLSCKRLRIDGELSLAEQADTTLAVDTAIVAPTGVLSIGSPDAPCRHQVTVRFTDDGSIDIAWDPLVFSRGLITHGAAHIHGLPKTAFAKLAVPPQAGDTVLQLAEAQSGWNVGDTLLISGVVRGQHELRTILAVNMNAVEIDPLAFDHVPPAVAIEEGAAVYAANLTRSIRFESAGTEVSRLGHVMFMHSPNVTLEYASFDNLGRTNKAAPVTDPKVDANGVQVPGSGDNPRGRYSVHFHRTGLDHVVNAAGLVATNSPGWGITNHSSNVHCSDSIAFNCLGSGFTGEVGNELGDWKNCYAEYSVGSGDGLESRARTLEDWGHGGHGFWHQGPLIGLENCIAAGHAQPAFIWFTNGPKIETKYLPVPEVAGGLASIRGGDVPMKSLRGLVGFASHAGFETWTHLLIAKHDFESTLEDSLFWDCVKDPVQPLYTAQFRFVRVKVARTGNRTGVGFGSNNFTGVGDFTWDDCTARGFNTGIRLPVSGTNHINGGTFDNYRDIVMLPTNVRPDFTAHIDGLQTHIPHSNKKAAVDLHPAWLPSETLWANFQPRGTLYIAGKQVYYSPQQTGDYVPFPADKFGDVAPTELLDKTNRQMADAYGLELLGALAPPDAAAYPGLVGGVLGSKRDTAGPQLTSDRYSNQFDYPLTYSDAGQASVPLKQGWNLVTRKQTFLVYGDREPPVFVPAEGTTTTITRAKLQVTFYLKGTIQDDSFTKGFSKGFPLKALPILTREDGSEYVEIKFQIEDLAGNTTDVAWPLTIVD